MTNEAVCSSEIDIYCDLPDFKYGDQLEKLEKEKLVLTEKVQNLESLLNKAIEEKRKFEDQSKTLSVNISSLYKTAIAEIRRKDRTINDLRRKNNCLTYGTKVKSNYDIKSDSILVEETVESTYQEEEINVREVFVTDNYDRWKHSETLRTKPERQKESLPKTEYSRRMHAKYFGDSAKKELNVCDKNDLKSNKIDNNESVNRTSIEYEKKKIETPKKGQKVKITLGKENNSDRSNHDAKKAFNESNKIESISNVVNANKSRSKPLSNVVPCDRNDAHSEISQQTKMIEKHVRTDNTSEISEIIHNTNAPAPDSSESSNKDVAVTKTDKCSRPNVTAHCKSNNDVPIAQSNIDPTNESQSLRESNIILNCPSENVKDVSDKFDNIHLAKNNDMSHKDGKSSFPWSLIKVDCRSQTSLNGLRGNEAVLIKELINTVKISSDTCEKSETCKLNKPEVPLHPQAQVTKEAPNFHSKLINKTKQKSKSLFNPISQQWNKLPIQNGKPFGAKHSAPVSVKEKKTEFVQKNNFFETLFGSLSKWSDTESIECRKIDLSSPAVYEDSCSAQLENPKFRTPIENNSTVVHISNESKKVSSNLNIISSDKFDSGKSSFVSSRSDGVFIDGRLERGPDPRVTLRNSSPLLIENDESKNCLRTKAREKTPIKAKYDDSLLGQFEDTNQLISALTKVHATISPINTPQKEDREMESFSPPENLCPGSILQVKPVFPPKEESILASQNKKEETDIIEKETVLKVEPPETVSNCTENNSVSALPGDTNNLRPKVNILQPRKTPRKTQFTNAVATPQKISAFPQVKLDELSFTKGFVLMKEATKNHVKSHKHPIKHCSNNPSSMPHRQIGDIKHCDIKIDSVDKTERQKPTINVSLNCSFSQNEVLDNKAKESSDITSIQCSNKNSSKPDSSTYVQSDKRRQQTKDGPKTTESNNKKSASFQFVNKNNSDHSPNNHVTEVRTKNMNDSHSPKRKKLSLHVTKLANKKDGNYVNEHNNSVRLTSVDKKYSESIRKIERSSKLNFETGNVSSRTSVVNVSPLRLGKQVVPSERSERVFVGDRLDICRHRNIKINSNDSYKKYEPKPFNSSNTNRLFSNSPNYRCRDQSDYERSKRIPRDVPISPKRKSSDFSCQDVKNLSKIKNEEKSSPGENGNQPRSRVIIRTSRKIQWTTTTTTVIQKCMSENDSQNQNCTSKVKAFDSRKGEYSERSDDALKKNMPSDSTRKSHSPNSSEINRKPSCDNLIDNSERKMLPSSPKRRKTNEVFYSVKEMSKTPEKVIIRNKNSIFSDNDLTQSPVFTVQKSEQESNVTVNDEADTMERKVSKIDNVKNLYPSVFFDSDSSNENFDLSHSSSSHQSDESWKP